MSTSSSLKQKVSGGLVVIAASLFGLEAGAAVIPVGIQTSVSQATVDSWGWVECHRSNTNAGVGFTEASCAGDYLMMGVWDASLGAYGVIGAGSFGAVTAETLADYQGDNAGYAGNWDNGLNWYRTSGAGSWGFSTIAEINLNTADINLFNGFQSQDSTGTNEGPVAAAGLSFHISNANSFSQGWAYNPDGNHHTLVYDQGDQRVFWALRQNNVPEPGTLALLGLGLAGLGLARRRKTN